MLNSRKLLIFVPFLVFIHACQATSQPVQQVENSSVTQIVPVPTTDPNQPVGNPFDPKLPPLEVWKGIPIMSQATAGEEAEGMYGYKVDATPEKISSFYVTRLIGDEWVQSFSLPYSDGMGIMMYTRGTETLTVTISEVNGYMLVLLNLQ